MNGQSDVAWRLLVRCGEEVGAGFVVAGGFALTCAHVVNNQTRCTVTLPAGGDAIECGVEPVDGTWDFATKPWSDIAVITLPPGLKVAPAPLGPVRPKPSRGALLDVFGFPSAYEGRGQRTQVHVVGDDEFGKSLQVNGLVGYDGRVAPGYSGSAAVDVNSGRVVGMVTAADRDPSVRIAWVIPLETVAELWHPLADMMPHALSVDPDFMQACQDLNYRRYGDALSRLNKLASVYPDEADIYFYQVLAGLAGTRPGRYAIDAIEAIEQRLRWAWKLASGSAQIGAVWAVLKEDYYIMRGFSDHSSPSLDELKSAAANIKPDYARLVTWHIPAPECPTWKFLVTRSV
jgi:Trypsin-like peptidase domain